MFAFTCRREFPGGSVVRPQRFQCRSPGYILGWRTGNPKATQCGQIKKKKKTKLLCVCLTCFLKALLQMEVLRG